MIAEGFFFFIYSYAISRRSTFFL